MITTFDMSTGEIVEQSAPANDRHASRGEIRELTSAEERLPPAGPGLQPAPLSSGRQETSATSPLVASIDIDIDIDIDKLISSMEK